MVLTRRWLGMLLLAGVLGGCASTPKFHGLGADEVYAIALRHLEAEEWGDAGEALDRFIFSFPTDGRIADARLQLAETFTRRDQHLSAAAEYEAFLERYPSDPRLADAAIGVCRAYVALSPAVQRDQSHTQQAVTACQNVALDFPGSGQGEEAEELRDRMLAKLAQREYEVGEFYFRRGLHDSAILSFERVIERYPATESSPKALLALYRTYLVLRWEPEAEAAKERLLTQYPNSSAAREVGELT